MGTGNALLSLLNARADVHLPEEGGHRSGVRQIEPVVRGVPCRVQQLRPLDARYTDWDGNPPSHVIWCPYANRSDVQTGRMLVVVQRRARGRGWSDVPAGEQDVYLVHGTPDAAGEGHHLRCEATLLKPGEVP